MVESPVKPLIVRLAIPTTISMLVTSLYNIADTYFVSQLGKSVSGAVGVVFSLMAIIQAIGFTLGMGAGSVISRALGVKDGEKANRYASVAFFIAILAGVLLTIFGTIFLSPLVESLGATETSLPYAKRYAAYILFGAPLMMCSFVLNNILRAEGKAAFAMIGLTIGGVLNIILDPLLISVANLGISGAAIATLISQLVSFLLLLFCFILHKSVVQLSVRHVKECGAVLLEIVKTGAPSFCRQGFASLSTILLNHQAGAYGGDAALSAMGITAKIFMCIFCVGLGLGQGFQPVLGYNYSAKKWRRVLESFRFTYLMGTVVMLLFGVAAYFLAPVLIPRFINDDAVIEIGTHALRFQAITMPLLSLNVICNMTFQSLGKKVRAVLLSCCRQGIFFIPWILLLPKLWGLTGVELTQAAADASTFLFSIPFAVSFYRHVSRKADALSEAEDSPMSQARTAVG